MSKKSKNLSINIANLIEAYNQIEKAYKSLSDLFKEKIDIDTLTNAQVNICETICNLIEVPDDAELVYIILADEETKTDRKVKLLTELKNE